MRRSVTWRVVFALGVLCGGLGCETAEQVEFGDPAKVAGGFGQGSSGAGDCAVNNACAVSWENRIYVSIFDAPFDASEPSGGCAEALCHANGAGGLTFPSDNPGEGYFRLTSYTLVGGRPYIVPCHPELSNILCNLRFSVDVNNIYIGEDANFSGGCGSPMPKPDEDVPAEPLNQQQLDDIAEWIACGAPQN